MKNRRTSPPPLISIWLGILLILNLVPLGNSLNQGLSGNRILEFRMDYLLHSLMILAFAWLQLLNRSLRLKNLKLLPFSLLVLGSAVGLELMQYWIPWRSFNQVDMLYGTIGAALAILFVWLDEKLRSVPEGEISVRIE